MKITIRKPLSFSEIGRKENQEDRIYPLTQEVTLDNRVFILCDGMGGHDNGEVASETVCVALGNFLDAHQLSKEQTLPELFDEALAYAYDELDKQDNGGLKKMGTTMTCLYLYEKGYLVAHIGDSRIYHIRPSQTDIKNNRLGIIYQSSDHSLVNDLLRMGELTEEEAVNFPQKNVITRAMQPHLEKRHKADVYTFSDIRKGDYFFLCCDGVLEQLTNERLCEILSDDSLDDEGKLAAIKDVCDRKTKDNYTCWLIPIEDVVSGVDDAENGDGIIQAVEIEEEAYPKTSHSWLSNAVSFIKRKIKHIFIMKQFCFLSLILSLSGSCQINTQKQDESLYGNICLTDNIETCLAKGTVLSLLSQLPQQSKIDYKL